MTAASELFRPLLSRVDPELLRLLRRAAVPRCMTGELMPIISEGGATTLADLPFLEQATWDPNGATYQIDASIRDALLAEWVAAPDELARLNAELARHFQNTGDGASAFFHRIFVAQERREALAELTSRIDAYLAKEEGDVAGAHDLLRVLTEHPLRSSSTLGSELERLIRELTPRINRRARWLREREATRIYYRRGFDDAVWNRLENGPQWLLEIHGPGGYGKTMFVQNLISRTCANREIPVARVDFDYVAHLVRASNQPWRLLLLAARQLADQMPGDPFGRLLASWGRFETQMIVRQRHHPAARTPRDIEETRGGEEVPQLFRAILAEWRRPVLIVLDTLENLFHAEGATLRSVIDALAEVRAGVPGLRVVLAGRFELAGKVDGQERVPGFHNTYLGPGAHRIGIAGTRLKLGTQALALSIPAFSKRDATRYLTETRQLSKRDERIAAIVEKCGGNPMKLAMLAEIVKGDRPPSADEIRRLASTELIYLVDRVIDRITDPRVQWLLRWGTIPQLLTREFAHGVLWPLLAEHASGTRIWDEPARDSLATLGRGTARYALAELPLDFDEAWNKLAFYAAQASWVSLVSELPDTLRFHPEVRDPIRGLLRREQQAIYHEASLRALTYWRRRARAEKGQARQRALCAAVFHALEPFDGRPGTPDNLFEELLADAGDNLTLRAALAQEVLDVERRAARADREDLPPPPPGVLAAAHAELALKASEITLAGRPALAELEHHLERSNLTEARRAVIEGEARLALGDSDEAERLFAFAMDRSAELDVPLRLSTALRVSELRGDVGALEFLVRAVEGAPEWHDAAKALARELERAERFEESRRLHESLGDAAGVARCFLGVGEIAAARATIAETSGPEADLVRAELYLASYDADSALEMSRRSGAYRGDVYGPSWEGLRARAEAMLGLKDASYGTLEAVTTKHDALDSADALTAARIFLDGDSPQDALRVLQTLPPKSPREIIARATVLRAEAEARRGDARAATAALETMPVAGLPLSVRVDAEITRLQIASLESQSALALVALVEEAMPYRRRLILLGGLARVPTPSHYRVDLDRLSGATWLDPDVLAADAAPLVFARVEVLRLALFRDSALALLERFVEIALARGYPPAVLRYVYFCLDRLKVQRGMLLERMRSQLDLFAKRAPSWLERLLSVDEAKRAEGSPPGLQGVGPLGLKPDVERPYLLAVTADLAVAFLEPGPGPWMLSAGARVPIQGPIWGQPNTTELPFKLLPNAVPACMDLGEQMQTWISIEAARELVVLLGHESHAWVPWQLAMAIPGKSLVASLGLRCLRRATTASTPAGPDSLRATGDLAVMVVSRDEHMLVRRRLSVSYDRVRADWRKEAPWRAWPQLLEQAPVIHVVGQFERRRGGELVLDLCTDANSATGSKHLARALAARETPSLMILEVPWPGSDTEAARQLCMREQFAWEILREHVGANVLCVGFADHPEAEQDGLDALPEWLLAERLSLADIVGRLQAMRTPPRSFGDLLARASATLYSNAAHLRSAM